MVVQKFPRPIADAILRCNHPIALVEGARAVGKTWVAKNELMSAGFDYVDLSDTNTLRSARNNPEEWFSHLPRPLIIDEAQLLEALPLLVKRAVDAMKNPSLTFILTGSASIRTNEFGNQDPLVRRSSCFKIDPLTRREIFRNTRNLVDDLWGGPPRHNVRYSIARDELYSYVQLGGFPQKVIASPKTTQGARDRDTQIDIERILGRGVEPGTDAYSASALLQHLLVKPGGILNISNLSKVLELNRNTVKSYLAKLLDRYLLHQLPNLRLQPHRQAESRSKIHPVDTTFSVNAFFKTGISAFQSSDVFGELLESYVVNQIIPSLSWSHTTFSAFYWRDSKNTDLEVDLVLKTGDKVMGIEVKSSTNVSSDDFKGLRALGSVESLAKGYVVYTGDRVHQFGENLWAIPIASLWDESAFPIDQLCTEKKVHLPRIAHPVQGDPMTIPTTDLVSDANLFLSYNHADNEYLDGAMVTFMKKVVETYEFEHVNTLTLFIDKESIPWGGDWRQILDRSIETTNFLLPQVTPRYLASAACRDELFKFNDLGENNSQHNVLPLVWQSVDAIDAPVGALKAKEIISRYQWIDVSNLRDMPVGNQMYREKVREIAKKLREVILHNREGDVKRKKQSKEPFEDSPRKILDDFTHVQQDLQALDAECLGTKIEIQQLGEAIASIPPIQDANSASFIKWVEALESSTNPHVEQLNAHVGNIEAIWPSINDYTISYIEFMNRSHNKEQLEDLLPTLYGLRNQFTIIPEMRNAIDQFRIFQMLTSRFTPIMQALASCLDLFEVISSDVESAIDRIREGYGLR